MEINAKEKKVLEAYLAKIKAIPRKTSSRVIVGMVGLPGTNRAEVASLIAKDIGAVLISADDLRLKLGEKKLPYDNVREMLRIGAEEFLKKDCSVLIESDHIDPDKRNRLSKIAKDSEAILVYVRTHCDMDVMVGNLVSGKHSRKKLFEKTETVWKGANRQAVVGLKEVMQRLPLHFSWSKLEGGEWVHKNIAFAFAEIDTTNSSKINSQVRSVIPNLKSL